MQNLQTNITLQGGKYKIINTLGQGGFGITYLAVQSGLDREVAIKEFFMRDLCERDASTSYVTLGTESCRTTFCRFREKFLKEARHIAKLNHPNIVRIIDVFEENGTAYYVMEYCENGSLSNLVKKHGHLSESIATRYILQVAEALGYIHKQKMNHLDVKPTNIMLNEKDEAVLIDFGLSKQYDSMTGNQTSTTPVGISHGYAPLEQYKEGGVKEFSPETDIYALGATFFKLLTGITPPNASDINEDGVPVDLLKAKNLSQQVITVICKAMEGRKKNRMKDVKSFIDSLSGRPSDDDEKTHIEHRKDVIKEDKGHNEDVIPIPHKHLPRKWIFSIITVITITCFAFYMNFDISQNRNTVISGYEFVDLGLSVKWASKNVGASSPFDYGNYYAWGETTTKSWYQEDNSKTNKKNMGDIAGSSQYDAARANWGGTWRLPTKTELQELLEKCIWIWTPQGGHNGYRIISKANGNSIFLPAARNWYGSTVVQDGKFGCYMSSTPYESEVDCAYALFFDLSSQDVSGFGRYCGFSVRPVSE